MKGNAVRLGRFVCALLGVMAAGWFLVVHAAKPTAEGLPTDWTHRHVIFSQPATLEQAQRIAQDPRYWQQWYREKGGQRLALATEEDHASSPDLLHRILGAESSGLWAENMGMNATAGAGNYPAKYSFQVTTASCSDYVVFSTGLAGSTNQASIIAYDNIYSGCAGSPSVDWAYNTGGQILTSPVISGDGTQIAFVQTSGGVGSLVVLKYAASGGSANGPVTLTPVSSASSYRGCTAPCMVSIPLNNSSNVQISDTASSVFPDYVHDTIYVGGASSWLFKFSGVFRGTPTEVTTGGFPLQVNSTTPTALTSPVYDYGSGYVFVADFAGYLYKVSPTGGVTTSKQLDHGAGIVVSPIVDSTAGLVYAFSTSDGSAACGGPGCGGVYIFKITGFPGTPAEAKVGTASPAGGYPLYPAGFDSAYLNSTTGTGNLYVCGGTGEDPIIYRVSVATGTVTANTETVTLTPAGDSVPCSPVTDIYNPNAPNVNGVTTGTTAPAEWVFFGVQADGIPSGCTSGCAIGLVSLPWSAGASYVVGQEILVRRTNATSFINVAIVGGTTAATIPAWSDVNGTQITDGTVTWLNQGEATTTALAGWVQNHRYAANSRILDTNNNVEVMLVAGRSGGTAPTWPTTAGATTTDGAVTWYNAGVWPITSLTSAGGVSGIIIDNVVASGTEKGASQIYFSTLTNQTCSTSGSTGGCAIQASQTGLN